MVSFLRNLYMRITIFYQKFYFLLFTIFLMGTIDLVVSTDFFLAMFSIPEAGPTILVLIFCVGLYMYLKHFVFKKKEKAKEDPQLP